MELNYVFSALSMLGLIKKGFLADNDIANAASAAFTEISHMADGMTKPLSTKYDLTTSMLFNAFTEERYSDHMKRHNNFGVKDFYADSGGLQMITTGKTITDELKDQVYKVQAKHSAYAMCFDEIALETETISNGKVNSERSNVSNKRFVASKHIEAGIQTGKNIKRQVQHFRAANSDARVIVIIQGNTYDDMYDFYNAITSQLDEEDYDYIGGMAVADTCMGNKALESIDMTIATHKISQVCHPNLCKHLHYLGVGSISRLEPVMMLHENFLPRIQKISYDSSTHSLTFNNGVWNGSRKNLGVDWNPTVHKNFKEVFDTFEPIASRFMKKDDIESVFTKIVGKGSDGGDQRKYPMSHLYQNFMGDNGSDLTDGERVMCAVFPYMYIRTVTLDFISRLSKIDSILAEKGKHHILALRNVKDIDDMLKWRNTQTRLPSARIKREIETLESFMS